jgi:8-oxo-dGTP pyrophosphatase MutT (NUDIX family)
MNDLKYVVIVECALELNGRFLIIKRPEDKEAVGLLAFPGGKVESKDHNDAESRDAILNAVKREIFEEIGINIFDPIRYVVSNHFKSSNGSECLILVFHCVLNKTNPIANPSAREVPEYYWLTTEEINQAPNSPVWLKEYLSYIV